MSNVLENKGKPVSRYLESLQKKRKYQRKENTGKLSLKEFPIPVEREPAYAASAAAVSENENPEHSPSWFRGQCDAMREKKPRLSRCR